MRWNRGQYGQWRGRFALLPTSIGDQWVWLERYGARDCGEYVERRLREKLGPPRPPGWIWAYADPKDLTDIGLMMRAKAREQLGLTP